MRGNDLRGIFHLDTGVEDTIGINHHIGTLLAETVAPDEIDAGILQSLPPRLRPERLIDRISSPGDAPGATANENAVLRLHV